MASGASASEGGQWPWKQGMWCKCRGCLKCQPHWRFPDPCSVGVTKNDRAYHPESLPHCEKCREYELAQLAQQLPPHAHGSGSATHEVTASLETIKTASAKLKEQLGDMAEQVGAIAEAASHLEGSDHSDASWLHVGSETGEKGSEVGRPS